MKSNKLAPKKNTAQAMVEFAIVLPILLVLLYGLLEAGRLLFMYSSIVTASRQAVRYGATTGAGGNYTSESGPDNSAYKRYQDCYGIRRAANRVDYLNAFNHTGADVTIEYNTIDNSGNVINVNGTDGNNICNGASDAAVNPGTDNKTRIEVTVTGHFNPIVRLVPFGARTITARSARTILTGVSITVAGAGAADTETTLALLPHRDPQPNSNWGELITATITVSNLSGSTLPTGTVDLSMTISGVTSSIASCQDVNVINGVATCYFTFPSMGDYSVTATYTPTNTAKFKESSGSVPSHTVGKANTTTTVTDIEDPSVINTTVFIHVVVSSPSGTSTPGGTVDVTTTAGNCTVNLDSSGAGNCNVTYTSLGITEITAEYNGDSRHLPSEAMTPHEVLTGTPTPKPPTAIPTVPPVTAVPTAVSNCQTIREAVYATSDPIQFLENSMYVEIPNPNSYPVTIASVSVNWNQAGGHIGTDPTLRLISATIDSTTVWQPSVGIYEPDIYTISSFSSPAILAANHTTLLSFNFDQTYGVYEGEAIQVMFSTPGCESFPILLPVGTSAASLKIQLQQNGQDGSTQSAFAYKLINTGSVTASNISVLIFFTKDSGVAVEKYVLEKDYDSSGAYPGLGVISGPTKASGNIYYFTINYGTASLAPAGIWDMQLRLHLSDWGAFNSANDWWHGTGSLPGSFTDWPYIPARVDTTIVWGTPP